MHPGIFAGDDGTFAPDCARQLSAPATIKLPIVRPQCMDCPDPPIVLIAMSLRLFVLVPRPDRQCMRLWNCATLWAQFARRRHRCCAAAFGVVDRVAINGETDCLTHAV